MSMIDRLKPLALPFLVDGETLDQKVFHARYSAMPASTRAELVEGVVHVASPLYYDHGAADDEVGLWLSMYRAFTPGVSGAANVSTRPGLKTEVQPDRQLRLLPEKGDDRGLKAAW